MKRVDYHNEHDTCWMKKTLDNLKDDEKEPEETTKKQPLNKALVDHLITEELNKGTPDETQRRVLTDVIKAACTGGTFHVLLHGGPGSGKTYSTNQIVKVLMLAAGTATRRSRHLVSNRIAY